LGYNRELSDIYLGQCIQSGKRTIKKDEAEKLRPKQNGAKKAWNIKGIKLKICRRAKNHGAIRQAG